ncbi:hypothetical protein [Mycolicibacterium sp. F2034L]|uniref:hypothetical protein n=1 Tax=Mycolicibacterium sp. F2034L TaxID=2926422 RepID=UPI001FF5DCC3|nr:hypothetical protein [Mycolicibacterium sp. F2034L]MCK0175204.1 hypothetical protein [Mycolicibacterium sp. F2034L]
MGAGAMAISPVTPTTTDIQHDVRKATSAVALAATENPLVLLQQSFTETLVNSGYLLINSANASQSLAAALGGADILGDIGKIIVQSASDPAATFEALRAFQELSGTTLQKALFGPDNPDTERIDGGLFTNIGPEVQNFLSNVLPDILRYDTPTEGATPGWQPRQGDEVPGVFTQALFEFNYWFVENFLRVVQPLTPLNDLTGQLIASLPGGADSELPALLGALSEAGLTRALVGPFQTVGFQFTIALDTIHQAINEGDITTAAGELISLPIKLTNAFVNGYTPFFSICSAAAGCEPRALEWPSQLDPSSQGGLVRYALVDFPNALTRALTGTPVTPVTPDDPNVPPKTQPTLIPVETTTATATMATTSGTAARSAAPAADVTPAAAETPVAKTVGESAPTAETATVEVKRDGSLSRLKDRVLGKSTAKDKTEASSTSSGTSGTESGTSNVGGVSRVAPSAGSSSSGASSSDSSASSSSSSASGSVG